MKKRTPNGHSVAQNMKVGRITSRGDVTLSQTTSFEAPNPPTSPAKFAEQLMSLLKELNSLSNLHPDIKAARTELQAASDEAKESVPDSSKIRKALLVAKGFLETAAETVAPVVPLVKTVADLARFVPTLFGK